MCLCVGNDASSMSIDLVIPVAMVVKNMIVAMYRWFKRG